MSLFGDIGKIAGGVVNTVEHAAGDVVKAAEGAIGGVAQVGEGIVGDLVKNSPAGELFGVLKNVGGGLLGEILGNKNSPEHQATPVNGGENTGGTGGLTEGGGSIFDKLFALLAKLQDKLGQKMDEASKIDPSNQAGLQKAMFEVQQIQSQMQELVTTATNLQKTEHDTQMSIARNFA